MEYTIIKEAHENMARLAERHSAALVAFSGGKDSLVCLDLAVKHFRRVVPFFLFLAPGLRCIAERMEPVRQRYGLEIMEYPHFLLFNLMANSIYCKKSIAGAMWMREFGLNEMYMAIIHDTGVRVIINGAKKSDSLWRRQKFFKFYAFQDAVYPLEDWRKNDVLAYLAMNNIPLPATSAGGSTGIDLSTPSLLWLHDNYPDDFERMEAYFPYIGAVVKRRDWYGVK